MIDPTPSDSGELRPIRSADRRWMVVPILVVAFVGVAIAKPWGGGEGVVPQPSTSPALAAASDPPTTSASNGVPSPIPLVALPAAAEVVASVAVAAAPWANELAVDAGGAWAWSDGGDVLRVDAATDTPTHIDLGPPSAVRAGPLGSRGIAVAWSQVWASDPGHRGLARIDPATGSVAERVQLWPADAPGSPAATSDAAARDRWASAWGIAIDGNSIFVPSITPRPGDVADPAPAGGELWRVDTASGQPPSWISIDRPTGVAVGFGSVWVVSCCGRYSDARTFSIVRLEKETGGIQASITLPIPEAAPDGRPVVRVGPDSVWVGLTDVPLIVRIDPATNRIRSMLPVDLPVSDIAIGDDGSIWLTESEAWYSDGAFVSDRCDGHLVRVDPATERQVAATTMACPMSVAISGRDVWVGSAGTEGSLLGRQVPSVVHLRAVAPAG